MNDLIDNHNLKKYQSQLVDTTEEKYYTIDSEKKGIKGIKDCPFLLFHLNIRSLNKHSTQPTSLLTALNADFDCICLTEVNKANLNSYSSLLSGYIFHSTPPKKGNFGGVVLFIKQDIKIDRLDRLECVEPCENLWIQLRIDN